MQKYIIRKKWNKQSKLMKHEGYLFPKEKKILKDIK